MNNQKYNTSQRPGFLALSWDAWKTARAGRQGIARRQQERLAALVSYARAHSRFFADLYREVPEPCAHIGQLPVVTKTQMMGHFDEWVTDPARGGGLHRRSLPDRARLPGPLRGLYHLRLDRDTSHSRA